MLVLLPLCVAYNDNNNNNNRLKPYFVMLHLSEQSYMACWFLEYMILSLILPLIADSLHDEHAAIPSCYGFNIQHFSSVCLINSFISTDLVEHCDSDVRTVDHM